MMKKDWKKLKTVLGLDGEKTIIYTNDKYPDIKIESRKRNIPHANGQGTWQHTEYVVVMDGVDVIKNSLRDAIEFAETYDEV